MLPVIEVDHLRTYFHTDDGVLKAVDDISFRIEQGRTLDCRSGRCNRFAAATSA
jgi:ABC-type oligopeptide transport system ATPase subunit